MATLQHTSFQAFIKRHPVLTYYALAFAISWGVVLLVIGGPGGIPGTSEQIARLLPSAIAASYAGPAFAGLLLTGLVSGRAGLRDVRSRLLRWRVSARWYAVALLTAPLLLTAIDFAFSLTSPAFLPAIITASDKTSLLLPAIVVGLAVPFFEELGWTGFAIPELRKRHGLLATGLIMGLLWGVWHFPLFSGSASSSGAVPPVLYVAVLLFSWLPPYRMLMVWVYDHTKSLFVAMLMHVPIVVGQFILGSPAMLGVPNVISVLVQGAMLWVVVVAVAVANSRKLSQGENTRTTPLTNLL